ncbi:hypothetical protein PMAYCL1PPCAC_25411, partial [Pristionchus mayeri]
KTNLMRIQDFSCWTTTHAVPHIGMANRKILGIFWTIILIGCFAGFIYQLRSLILKYLLYEVNTETKRPLQLAFSERPFPAVMICHLNPWKGDSIYASPFLSEMYIAYTNASDPNAFFGFEKGRTGERQQRGMKLTTLASDHMFSLIDKDGYKDPHYTYEDLVISCTYNVEPCNKTDWTPVKDPNFGMCYVYNANSSMVTTRAGPLYGLRVVMRTNQDLYLPWTEAAGIVVSIYNQSEIPYPEVLGYYAPPGTASSMGVRYVKTTRKGAPYGTCRVSKVADFAHYKGHYQVESCFRSCLQEQIIKKCGCYDPSYAYLGGPETKSCFGDGFDNSTWEATSDNLDCMEELYDSSATSFNMINDCADCTPPCEVQTYMTTVSSAQWPSNEFRPAECTAYNQTGQPWLLPSEDASEPKCLAWYKKHTLLVEVYYERMNYQILSESAAYTVVNLISDIGNQMGLFLGMSLISILETLVLVFLLCWYCTTHKKRNAEMAAYQKAIEMEKKKTEEFFKKNERQARDGRKDSSSTNGRKDSTSMRKESKPRRKGMSNAVYNPRNLSDAYKVPPVHH